MPRKKPDEPAENSTKPVGRPSTYSEETTDAICVELMAGRSVMEM